MLTVLFNCTNLLYLSAVFNSFYYPKFSKAREEVAETEGHMSKELSSKTKLVDLYKV